MARQKKNAPQTFEKGVIYARYSPGPNQRDESIEGQLRDCHAFARQYGITIVGEYCDHHLTGTNDRRPEFQRMIRDSAKGQFTVVILWKIDRFARSKYDSAIYKHKLKQNGVKVLYAKEAIPEGPVGIVVESVMEGFAEYYSANLSENVKRGMYDSALKRQTLGQFVYGLQKAADGRWEHNPKEAPIVRRIFEEYAAGQPATTIYKRLNDEGYRTRMGNPFNKNSLRRILKNEKYIGVYRYEDIYDDNGIPPIIDRELFAKVQSMVKQHHEKPAAKKVDGGFLLTSKLFCGECGAPMTGDGGTGKSGRVYQYYTCNNRRLKTCTKERAPKEWIEDIVVQALADIANDDDMIETFADRYMEWQEKKQKTSLVASFDERLKKIESAMKNILDVIEGGFVTDSLKSRLVELESERVSVEAGKAKALIEEPDLKRTQVVFYLRRFRDADTSDVKWRIFLVETFLKAAYLYDDGRLLLHLNYSGDNNTVTLQVVENTVEEGEALCSNFAPPSPPKRKTTHRVVFLFVLGFINVSVCENSITIIIFMRIWVSV